MDDNMEPVVVALPPPEYSHDGGDPAAVTSLHAGRQGRYSATITHTNLVASLTHPLHSRTDWCGVCV